MESRVRNILRELEDIQLSINHTVIEIDKAVQEGKKGKVQQILNTRKYLFKRLSSFKDKLRKIIKGEICNIRYEYKNPKGELIETKAILINLNDQEIEDVLKLYCRFSKYTLIRILEIQRVPTKLC